MDSKHAAITKMIHKIMSDLLYPNHFASHFFTWIKNTNKIKTHLQKIIRSMVQTCYKIGYHFNLSEKQTYGQTKLRLTAFDFSCPGSDILEEGFVDMKKAWQKSSVTRYKLVTCSSTATLIHVLYENERNISKH